MAKKKSPEKKNKKKKTCRGNKAYLLITFEFSRECCRDYHPPSPLLFFHIRLVFCTIQPNYHYKK